MGVADSKSRLGPSRLVAAGPAFFGPEAGRAEGRENPGEGPFSGCRTSEITGDYRRLSEIIGGYQRIIGGCRSCAIRGQPTTRLAIFGPGTARAACQCRYPMGRLRCRRLSEIIEDYGIEVVRLSEGRRPLSAVSIPAFRSISSLSSPSRRPRERLSR